MSYPILLVDDNASLDFLKPLRETAYTIAKFDLHFQKTWEEARNLLENSNGYYRGLILDGKGQKTLASKVEDDSFLDEVKEWLREKARVGVYVPYVVYTGFADELKKYFGNLDIYWKDRGEEEQMLKKLLDKINNSELEKYRQRFPNLFAVVGDKYLPQSCSSQLLNLLKWSEEDVPHKAWFNTLRDLIEEIFRRASQIDNIHFLPSDFLNLVQNGRPNLKACALFWAGREVDLTKVGKTGKTRAPAPILPPHNSWLTSSLVEVCQIFSHPYAQHFSIYSYRSCVNSLGELLIWFKQYIDKNYPNL